MDHLVLIFPNELTFTPRAIRNYEQHFDAAPAFAAPVQFPPYFTSVYPDQEVCIFNGHRAPSSVPCEYPSACTIQSHRLTRNPFSQSWPSSTRSASPSLSPVTPPSSPMVAFSHLALARSWPMPDSVYQSELSSPISPASPAPPAPPLSSAGQQALVPTFSVDNAFDALNSVLGDPTLRSFAQFSLGSQLLNHTPSGDDVLPVLDSGHWTYRVRPSICFHMEDAFDRIADFIHCAANDHNPYFAGGRPDIPTSIPTASLEELGTRIPGASLFRMYHARMQDRRFPNIDSALEFIHTAKRVYNYYIHWIANAIRMSTEFGYHSSWNWGAPFGMSVTEFIHRITRHFFYGGYRSLQRLMAHQLLRTNMEFACAELLTVDEDIRLLVISRSDHTYVAMWPLAEPAVDLGDLFVGAYLHAHQLTVDTLHDIFESNEPSVPISLD
ncbi:hypothetical protein B0H17DRAFT_1220655 [Mycena rosella]|uniref:Uncharacterized protein n=1 Tax=Mycena rosella TaxID=1033263 RepID=A0AAD7FBM0_MYCRO|nr:hypothetical protein B0H17DRAFT_1220655 [Mycena rosella]